MKSIWKIIKIVFIFFLFLTIISFVWYKIEENNAQTIPFVDYVLYLLGYGELELDNHYTQTFFSTLGLFALTLLSSIFTVSLFELRGKLKISPKIKVETSDARNYISVISLKTSSKDVYNLTIKLIAKIGDSVIEEEQYVPFIPKNITHRLNFKIVPGSVVYKYLKSIMQDKSGNASLLVTVVYTDIDNGQEYTLCEKYMHTVTKSDFININNTVTDYIKSNTFEINLMEVKPINSEDIDISYGYMQNELCLPKNSAFQAIVNMNSNKVYEPSTFAMACITDCLGNDWTKYYDMGCSLTFDYKVTGNIALTFEFKYNEFGSSSFTELFSENDDFEHFSLDLTDFRREDMAHIHELCFTVFYKHVDLNNPFGTFVIKNCALQVES